MRILGLGFLGGALAIAVWVALEALGLGVGGSPTGGSFEQRVRAYLVENPEVLIESLERLEARRQTPQTDEMAQIIAARSGEIFADPATPVGGNPEGDVSIVEFFDYNCPYCRRMAPIVAEMERNDPGLRLVYKEWPILGPNSEFAARAALAARKQGKYKELHRGLMSQRGLVSEGTVLEVAAEVGIDLDRLRSDMDAPEINAAIERNRELARALRIQGTPTFVIGDAMLRGAADINVMWGYVRRAREN